MSMVSCFHRFRTWCQWFHTFMVSWFHTFRGVDSFIGFVVSMVSWFHRFHQVMGFVVS